ncbi:MAG TPA: hypothetical protein VEQ85_04650, partial [Lacipirellulaceae bacterium]|nr:hypothetical protein [Lacipirellulaceae bacterium]
MRAECRQGAGDKDAATSNSLFKSLELPPGTGALQLGAIAAAANSLLLRRAKRDNSRRGPTDAARSRAGFNLHAGRDTVEFLVEK